jgi:predicted regulator of Ras-like GTPase activity (Roadblock/LC7/MglB family)
MDAAQALADLTEISAQIQAAVLATADGSVVAETWGDEERAQRFTRAALDLLAAAEQTRPDGGDGLAQLEGATPDGSVFVVRDERHVVAAVTPPQPTVGLVFYDLRTCLRLLEQAEQEKKEAKPAAPRKRTAKKEAGGEA